MWKVSPGVLRWGEFVMFESSSLGSILEVLYHDFWILFIGWYVSDHSSDSLILNGLVLVVRLKCWIIWFCAKSSSIGSSLSLIRKLRSMFGFNFWRAL